MRDGKLISETFESKRKIFDPKPFDSDIFVVNNRKNELTDYEITQGWRLLFNGQNAEGWVGAYKDSFPDFGWSISDGVLTIAASDGGESTNAGDIVTERKIQRF